MNDKIKGLLQSRRFWVAISGVVTVVTQSLGLTTLSADQVQYIIILAASWIVGDSIRTTEVTK